MTSATELMKMLDEAGVRYTYRNQGRKTYVHWGEPMVNGAMFTDGGDWSELTVENATPEQAIAATLGAVECEMETDYDELHRISDCPEDTWAYKCSACEWPFRYNRGIKPDFCPHCGKAVKR